MALARDGTLVFRAFRLPSGESPLAEEVPGVPLLVSGHPVILGNRPDDGVTLVETVVAEHGPGLALTLTFEARRDLIRVRRHVVAYPRAPVLETWIEVERLDGEVPVEVSGIGAWSVSVNGREGSWTRGLAMTEAPELAFRRELTRLLPGEQLVLGATGRSTERVLPWLAVRTSGWTFFGGLPWSGPRRLAAAGTTRGTHVTAALAETVTTVPAGRALEGLRGFLGGVPGDDQAEVAMAVRTFLVDGLRGAAASQRW